VQEVESTLTHLLERGDGPLVARLRREPGRRESRYAHLFSGEVQAASEDTDVTPAPSTLQRLDRLEQLVGELRQEVEQLKRRLVERSEG
jgi:uncharacterized protein YceH (UPF0502 family)